jgi:tRNA uridine 5-carboxymethylaminomethyl modification enzyme
MFTSRAEYRLILRQDDADMRLTEKSHEIGLASLNRINQLQHKKEELTKLRSFLENYSIKPNAINEFLRSKQSSELKNGCKLSDLVLRPQLNITDLVEAIPALKQKTDIISSRKEEIIEATEVLLKYEGYIEREKLIAEKLQRLEHVALKGRIDYNSILSLSTEARQKLTKIDPENIGQASRIPGISPSDVNILLVLLGR